MNLYGSHRGEGACPAPEPVSPDPELCRVASLAVDVGVGPVVDGGRVEVAAALAAHEAALVPRLPNEKKYARLIINVSLQKVCERQLLLD